ncbi:MAG: hypothetical protein JWO36_870 [Myxococcales bacterium]|nr:hypothetical protein [Myxococcales bacterium]
MRLAALATAITAALATPAFAAPPPTGFRLVEDGALGIELPKDHSLLGGVDDKVSACANGPIAPEGSGLFWLEISRAGKVSAAFVHGTGKLDRCLEKALTAGKIADKLAAPIILIGHIDLMRRETSEYLPSPRVSQAPVLLDAHNTKWQLTATRISYTTNRMLDIAQALDGASAKIASCAPKRGAKAAAARAVAWTDGHARVRSGTPAYDDCVANAVSAIKLPAADSAFWMELEITAPAEPLAARTENPNLTHEQAMRDALTTAVRSRKLDLRACLDGHPNTKLDKLAVVLDGEKANARPLSTGNADADVCIRNKFHLIAIPSATARDHVELEVTLDAD